MIPSPRPTDRLLEALETEWLNGNLDEGAYLRLEEVAKTKLERLRAALDRIGAAALTLSDAYYGDPSSVSRAVKAIDDIGYALQDARAALAPAPAEETP